MKLQVDPSIIYCINAGSFSIVSVPTCARSVTTYGGRRRGRGRGSDQFLSGPLSVTTGKEDDLSQKHIQREVTRVSNCTEGYFVEECSQHNLKGHTELPTWTSTRCTHGAQRSPQTRVRRRWRTFLLQRHDHGELQSATPLPNR